MCTDKSAKRRASTGYVSEDLGIELKPFYSPDDLTDFDYQRDLGDPGRYPFARGLSPDGYRSRPWTVRNYAGFGLPEDTNQRFKLLLSQGQTGLSMAFDAPTQLGIDSDDPLADGQVGMNGVAIDTLADMERIFTDIPLKGMSCSFTINQTAPIILAMYATVAEKQGVPTRELMGVTQNDMFREYIDRGLFVLKPADSLRISIDVMEWCLKNAPKFNPINIVNYFGLAGMFAVAFTYFDEMQRRGYDIDDFASRVSFLGTGGSTFFEIVAFARAARRLWARTLQERYGAKNPSSLRFRVAQGGQIAQLTAQQPLNNIVRIAIGALASALGGCQAMLLRCYDEAYAIPTEESVRVSMMTQQILIHEAGVTAVADPLGGSYFVESLTNAVEQHVKRRLADLDAGGGLIAAIERGDLQREHAQAFYEEQRQVESGEKPLIGMNRFAIPDEEEKEIEVFEYDPGVQERQIDRLRKVKEGRDASAVGQALSELRRGAQAKENMVPYFIEAVKVYATIGEIMNVLKEVHGEWREPCTV